MEVILAGNLVPVIIERKNNKNIYFRVKDDLNLYVSAHKIVSEKEIRKLIENNEPALTKMYIKIKNKSKKNEMNYYLGKPYPLIINQLEKKPYISDGYIILPHIDALEKFYKKECIKIFNERIDYIKPQIDFVPEFTLRIRKMRTRWGVCNKTSRVVTLNSELIKKDISLIDYVIIHELCHFKHPHHQASFWSEVSKYYPNYKNARKELKE